MPKPTEINVIRSTTARDLMAIYRELEGVRTECSDATERRQVYVVQFRQDTGSKRVAVIRDVARLPEGLIAMETTGGESILISAAQIEVWEPVLRRDVEPLPDGWWRRLAV